MTEQEQAERAIFASFIQTMPDFTDEPVKKWWTLNAWSRETGRQIPPNPDRPDIICLTDSDRLIGVELKAWLNREQMEEAKLIETSRKNILRAISELPPNPCRLIDKVWIDPKRRRFHEPHAQEFRETLFRFIQAADQQWDDKPDDEKELRDHINDFSAHPILNRYIQGMTLFPLRFAASRDGRPGGEYPRRRWITFPNRSTMFSPDEMTDPLIKNLESYKNDERYKNLGDIVGLGEVYLLMHYDMDAFEFNTPVAVPDFTFADAARLAAESLKGDSGYFNRIFLVNVVPDEIEAHRLH